MINPLASSLAKLQEAVKELQAAGYTNGEALVALEALWRNPEATVFELRTLIDNYHALIREARRAEFRRECDKERSR